MDAPAALREALVDRYRILRGVGEGGMATVYLAEDVRHHRQVALKVLRPELAAVVGGQRFISEIRTTANLQHPHILPLFDSGEDAGFLWFVMPYVAGESLAERLDREKQLPVDEAVDLAIKVAGALGAAHDQGVVHRDVKPGNILLTEAGEPLVADFGIALAVQEAGGGRLTETGLSLGTPWYMSPEQATADRDPDARSDLYSLGCVLYQMLTGEPPFQGGTAQAVLGRILTADPDPPSRVRRSVPPSVDAAVLRALEKTPADRFPSARDFAAALRDPAYRHVAASSVTGHGATSANTGGGAAAARSDRTPPSPRALLPWIVAAVLAAVAAWGWLRPASESAPRPAQLALLIPPAFDSMAAVAISPDGTTFALNPGADTDVPIQLRTLSDATWRPLPGTEDADGPFSFSPDGRSLVYATRDGELVRASIDGGAPLTLVEASGSNDIFEPHWGHDGSIVYVRETGIYRIPEDGGPVDTFQIQISAADPMPLPDGSGLLFEYFNERNIGYLDLATDSAWIVVEGGSRPRYLDSGHILFGRLEGGGLRAIAFDPTEGRVLGPEVPLVDDIPGRDWTISETGTMLFDPTPGPSFEGLASRFVRIDGEGRVLDTLPLAPLATQSARLSRDGERVAFIGPADGPRGPQLYVYDIARRDGPRRISDEEAIIPALAWSPDGDSLVYSGVTTANGDLRVRAWNGGAARELLALPEGLEVTDWTDDGWIVGVIDRPDGRDDLLVLRANAPQEARAFFESPQDESGGRVSPDGRWVAYAAASRDAPTVTEVRTFPDGRLPRLMMRASFPAWSPDGRRLYGVAVAPGPPPDTLKVVDVGEDRAPTGPARALYTFDFWALDVFPDGSLLLAEGLPPSASGGQEGRVPGRVVILDWLASIQDRLSR